MKLESFVLLLVPFLTSSNPIQNHFGSQDETRFTCIGIDPPSFCSLSPPQCIPTVNCTERVIVHPVENLSNNINEKWTAEYSIEISKWNPLIVDGVAMTTLLNVTDSPTEQLVGCDMKDYKAVLIEDTEYKTTVIQVPWMRIDNIAYDKKMFICIMKVHSGHTLITVNAVNIYHVPHNDEPVTSTVKVNQVEQLIEDNDEVVGDENGRVLPTDNADEEKAYQEAFARFFPGLNFSDINNQNLAFSGISAVEKEEEKIEETTEDFAENEITETERHSEALTSTSDTPLFCVAAIVGFCLLISR